MYQIYVCRKYVRIRTKQAYISCDSQGIFVLCQVFGPWRILAHGVRTEKRKRPSKGRIGVRRALDSPSSNHGRRHRGSGRDWRVAAFFLASSWLSLLYNAWCLWSSTVHVTGTLLTPKAARGKGPSINYVILVGGEGSSPKDDWLHRPYLRKKTTREVGGGQKNLILRRQSLWTARNGKRESKPWEGLLLGASKAAAWNTCTAARRAFLPRHLSALHCCQWSLSLPPMAYAAAAAAVRCIVRFS